MDAGLCGADDGREDERMQLRGAMPEDAEAVAAIYNEGIEERQATFETRLRSAAELRERIGSERLPFLVAERAGRVEGWASLAPYSQRQVYAGVAEVSVYVARAARGHGMGTRLLEALVAEAGGRGFHKLLGKLFETNSASVALVQRCGFRRVGIHRRHGRLEGEWRDVVLVERLLGAAAND
jgi:L-amino acid N-acyltransferase YncA